MGSEDVKRPFLCTPEIDGECLGMCVGDHLVGFLEAVESQWQNRVQCLVGWICLGFEYGRTTGRGEENTDNPGMLSRNCAKFLVVTSNDLRVVQSGG